MKVGLKGMGCKGAKWIQMVHGWSKWWAAANTVIIFLVS
jgi:hypothetical protein